MGSCNAEAKNQLMLWSQSHVSVMSIAYSSGSQIFEEHDM